MPGEEGWKSKEAAERYEQMIDLIVPGRREILAIIAEMATRETSDHPVILDLGCGPGDVTAAVLKQRPGATVYMIDFSDEMMRRCRERFVGNPDVHLVYHDLNQGLPPALRGIRFDSVASCFALHHVEFENRARLYGDVRASLRDNGLFINGDLFKGDAPAIDQWERDSGLRFTLRQLKEKRGEEHSFAEMKRHQLDNARRMGDKPGTIWEMYSDLRTSGFRYVDVLWKYYNLAILAASN